jgi:hypothetical protein
MARPKRRLLPLTPRPTNCHSERSDPAFSCAPVCGVPGRAVEEPYSCKLVGGVPPSSVLSQRSTFQPSNLQRSNVFSELSPVLSYNYKLFCTSEKRNPFLFKQIRTLLQKHPGGGYPLRINARIAKPTEAVQIRRTSPKSVARVLRTSSSTRIIPTNGISPAAITIGSNE